MTDTQELKALLDRVEKVEGADRELDLAIVDAFGLGNFIPFASHMPMGRMEKIGDSWIDKGDNKGPWASNERFVPHYTASIDAALALTERVLPGWYGRAWFGDTPPYHPHEQKSRVALWCSDRGKKQAIFGIGSDAATLPLSIIAATLRAKIAEADSGG